MLEFQNFQKKIDELNEVFYIPKSCNPSASGKGKVCRTNVPKEYKQENEDGSCAEYQETWSMNCPSLGRFKNARIEASHLSRQGQKIPTEKNAAGSHPIGFIGGAGGGDGVGAGSHSHIELKIGAKKVSFADAYCRTE